MRSPLGAIVSTRRPLTGRELAAAALDALAQKIAVIPLDDGRLSDEDRDLVRSIAQRIWGR